MDRASPFSDARRRRPVAILLGFSGGRWKRERRDEVNSINDSVTLVLAPHPCSFFQQRNYLHSDEQFFQDIFSPCGDAVPKVNAKINPPCTHQNEINLHTLYEQVRQYLIAQKDKSNELYAMHVLRDILGMEDHDRT